MTKAESLDAYQSTLHLLLESSLILSLGTINKQQQSEVSLVPFLYDSGCFWIFVSQLSSHTQHLFDRSDVSILVYNAEEKIVNPFAIKRLSAACEAKPVVKNKEEMLDLMADKLGETVSLLRKLGDFHLFCIRPKSGRLIAGFGQAFDIDFSTMSLTHISN